MANSYGIGACQMLRHVIYAFDISPRDMRAMICHVYFRLMLRLMADMPPYARFSAFDYMPER